QLLQLNFPPLFEGFHPSGVFRKVRYIHHEPHKCITVMNARVPPMTLHTFCLIAGGTELLNNLKHGISQPLGWNVAAVVELQWKHSLESPPPVAHSLPCPSHETRCFAPPKPP